MQPLPRLLCLCLGLQLLLVSGAKADAELCPHPVIIGWEPWPPYQYVNEDGILTGVDIDMASAIMSELHCQIEFQQVPWKRHLQGLKEGLLDIALGASKTPERAEYAHFSTPYRQELNSLFVRRNTDTESMNTMEDFLKAGNRLGVTLGYFYGDELQALMNQPEYNTRVSYVRDNIQLYQMLDKRRIDGFLADALTVSYQSRQFPEILEFQPVLYANSSHIYIMLSKKKVDIAFVNKLNKTLERMKDTGVLFKINSRYIIPEYQIEAP